MAIPTTQRAIVIAAPGGPEVLTGADRHPVPEPAAGEVLIEVVAAGVNRHDCNQRKAGPAHEPNPVPGLEVSGRIVAVGSAVDRSRIGEEVVALTDGGGYAEYVAAPAELALPRPTAMDWTSAAALPEALFTIWLNFFELMQLAPGESGLIHGGTSGVGSIGLQVLKALGHDVYATAGTAEKCAAALRFGARAAFDYNDPQLATQVLEATGQRGVDTLLDMSAGAHIKDDLAMLAADGRMAFLSAGAGKELAVPLRLLMARRIRITGALLRRLPIPRKIVIAKQLRRTIWPLLGTAVVPPIHAVYPLAEAAEAHRHIESSQHIGKIMLSVRDA
jgi:NADPH2:quinone reductase